MRLSLFLLGLGLCVGLNAQITNPKKVRFGKLSEAELALKQYELQPDAEAVVLFDEGRLRMDYDEITGNFESLLDRHLRIKILQPAGTEYANFRFLLEHSLRSSAREEIINIKGLTINIVEGKEEETKLNKDGIFTDVISDQLDELNITFPQVRAGSIIDLKYTFKSDYLFNLPTWYFQRKIPTDYSYFEAIIPEYFLYNLDMQGYASDRLVESVTNELGNRSIMVSSRNNQKLDFITRGYRWTAIGVPGLKAEVFAPAVSNYFFRVNFELSSVNFPGQLGTNYTQTWDDVVETYRDNAGNNAYLKPRKEVEELTQEWLAGAGDENERLLRIFEGVRRRVEWNGAYRTLTSQPPGELLKTSAGSSADINYLLISALRAGGFAAYPVLSSTQQNGYLSLTRPSLTQFNHVLVYVSLAEGQSYLLLDATHQNLPLHLLPISILNDRGRVLLEDRSEWIALKPSAGKKTAVQLQMDVSIDGQYSGHLKYKAEDYAALADRETAGTAEDMEVHLENWFGHELSDLEMTGFGNVYEEINVSAKIDASPDLMQNGDLFYVPAILATAYSENPFKTETRTFPIDLSVPQNYVYVLQLNLADGITVEELPESINFSLPDGKAKYSLRFIEMNGDVQIIEKLNIEETLYFTQDYPALKTFLDLIVEQQQATLVLRKGD